MYLPGKYYLHAEAMNLRDRHERSGKICCVVPQGTVLDITEVWDNWGKTSFEGAEGWCCISECFARRLCECGNVCCYLDSYRQLFAENAVLLKKLEEISVILKR